MEGLFGSCFGCFYYFLGGRGVGLTPEPRARRFPVELAPHPDGGPEVHADGGPDLRHLIRMAARRCMPMAARISGTSSGWRPGGA